MPISHVRSFILKNQPTGSWLCFDHIVKYQSDTNLGTKIQNGPSVKSLKSLWVVLLAVVVNIFSHC